MSEPAAPRLAATLLLVRDHPLEVLMVRRADRGHFASALVFPGGVVEPADHDAAWLPHLLGAEGLAAPERALRIAAIRETFEETAILLAQAPDGLPVAIERSEAAFDDLVRGGGLKLDLAALSRFAHWITPPITARRYDTMFYLASAPANARPVCDGVETVAASWVSPAGLLAGAGADTAMLPFPTRLNLARLAESPDAAIAWAACQARPVVTVTVSVERRPDGIILSVPADAGYGPATAFQPG